MSVHLSPSQGRGHLVIYGVEGKQNDVSSDVFDELYYLQNGKMNMIVPIDMNNKNITNVEVGDDDGDVVNFQKLNSYVNAAKILLNNKITELSTKINSIEKQLSYVALGSDLFNRIFEFYADLLDPEEFIRSGPNVAAFNDLTVTTSTGSPSGKPFSDFNLTYGFDNFYGEMDVNLDLTKILQFMLWLK